MQHANFTFWVMVVTIISYLLSDFLNYTQICNFSGGGGWTGNDSQRASPLQTYRQILQMHTGNSLQPMDNDLFLIFLFLLALKSEGCLPFVCKHYSYFINFRLYFCLKVPLFWLAFYILCITIDAIYSRYIYLSCYPTKNNFAVIKKGCWIKNLFKLYIYIRKNLILAIRRQYRKSRDQSQTNIPH